MDVEEVDDTAVRSGVVPVRSLTKPCPPKLPPHCVEPPTFVNDVSPTRVITNDGTAAAAGTNDGTAANAAPATNDGTAAVAGTNDGTAANAAPATNAELRWVVLS